jgi:hypothetical protein
LCLALVPVGALVCHDGLVDEQITSILRTDDAEAALSW